MSVDLIKGSFAFKNDKREIELLIVDVFVAISKAKECVRLFSDENELRQSSSNRDAVIRQIKIIGEALNRLLEDEQFSATSSSCLHNIVDVRDLIVHGDFGSDTFEVWEIITNKLVLLDNDLKNVVHTSNINIGSAIEAELMKYFHLDDKKTAGILKKLNREMY